jgi:hypothetical protein
MDLLIDTRGRRRQRCSARLPRAIWREGFIHIRNERRRVVISLSPTLVKGPTVAAAVYTIAEIDPMYVSVIVEKHDCVTIIFYTDWKTACRRICELVSLSRRSEQPQNTGFRCGIGPLTESEALGDPEHIIGAALNRHVQSNTESLSRIILEQLWEAGYDVCPIRC